MKIILNIFLLFSLIFVFSTCKNTISPTKSITFDKGEYLGTFSVTFKNYKNYNFSVTQSGTISISFTDSTYTYFAVANYSSDPTASDSLGDFGSYSIDQDKLKMNDKSWWLMNAYWQSSLYFEGTFYIQNNGSQLQISQDNSFAKWNLNLIFK